MHLRKQVEVAPRFYCYNGHESISVSPAELFPHDPWQRTAATLKSFAEDSRFQVGPIVQVI